MMYNLPSSGQGFRCLCSCMDESVLILNPKWGSFIYERIRQRDCTKCFSNILSLCNYVSKQRNCKEFFQVHSTHVTTPPNNFDFFWKAFYCNQTFQVQKLLYGLFFSIFSFELFIWFLCFFCPDFYFHYCSILKKLALHF